MKTSSIVVLLGLFLVFGACNKEVVPVNEMILGVWVTKDASLNAGVEFTIREMILRKNTQYSTQYYSIRNNSLYLYPDKPFDSDHFTTHAIYLNKKTDELRIRGLGGSVSGDDGYAVFVRQ